MVIRVPPFFDPDVGVTLIIVGVDAAKTSANGNNKAAKYLILR